ncbi:hypothetical protein BKA70DRAFT_1560871 [Coprinopsis sp. MPI-PUGE-AT-0042]|nr:hypothetical protein BKA70DRAFT_1560871 [Coprinopsis sp. MPI-PUGE-AT-0042]
MKNPPTKKELDGIKRITSPSALDSFFRSSRHVPSGMLLYDEPERDAIWELMRVDVPDISGGKSMEPTEAVVSAYRSIRTWRHLRFLHTYKGFVEGNLDLTGRHAERWNEYLPEFEEYMEHFENLVPTIEITHSVHKIMGYEFSEKSYELDDAERYVEWLDRWELDNSFSHSVIAGTFLCRELYKQKHPPKMQQLLLLGLPQELLEHIFDYCKQKDMASLSRTCSLLYHSGYAHLLRDLELGFDSYKYDLKAASKVPDGFDPEGDEDSTPLILPILKNARDWLIQHAEKLLARQHQLEFVKKAHFELNPRSVVPYWALQGLCISNELEGDLVDPVKRSLLKILPAFVNLQILELTNFELDQNAVRNPMHVEDPSSPIFVLQIGEWIMQSLWHTLCFCPSVRNLTIHDSSSKDLQRPVTFPPAEIWSKFKCSLRTIERVFIDGLGSRRQIEFFNWINTTRSTSNTSSPLALTHFKWVPSAKWRDIDVLTVLQALRSPSLRVLSLEGLPFELGQKSTVSFIAQCFPNLEALTLAIRANRRQWMTKVVNWRGPVWSFARTLTGFSCLEHFEWNHNIPPHTSTPSPFVKMEQHEVEGTFEKDGNLFYCWDDRYFDDYHLNAAPFAAYCPTLKTWVANKGAMFTSDQIVCEIRRRPQNESQNQGEEVKIVCVTKGDRPDLGKYDPSTYHTAYSTWPNVDL